MIREIFFLDYPHRFRGPVIFLSEGRQQLFLRELEWPRRETEHSIPSNMEKKKMRGAIQPFPHTWRLNMHMNKNNLTYSADVSETHHNS